MDYSKAEQRVAAQLGTSIHQEIEKLSKREVHFTCFHCGYDERKPERCPVTGILHGKGWVYRCPECGSDLEIRK
jgi:predicted RNA-binding Zn-ribbon protein involved in translation (DUF1610 family)